MRHDLSTKRPQLASRTFADTPCAQKLFTALRDSGGVAIAVFCINYIVTDRMAQEDEVLAAAALSGWIIYSEGGDNDLALEGVYSRAAHRGVVSSTHSLS